MWSKMGGRDRNADTQRFPRPEPLSAATFRIAITPLLA